MNNKVKKIILFAVGIIVAFSILFVFLISPSKKNETIDNVKQEIVVGDMKIPFLDMKICW